MSLRGAWSAWRRVSGGGAWFVSLGLVWFRKPERRALTSVSGCARGVPTAARAIPPACTRERDARKSWRAQARAKPRARPCLSASMCSLRARVTPCCLDDSSMFSRPSTFASLVTAAAEWSIAMRAGVGVRASGQTRGRKAFPPALFPLPSPPRRAPSALHAHERGEHACHPPAPTLRPLVHPLRPARNGRVRC